MLLLQRQSETVDNRAQNFQQLSNAVKPLRFVCELEEYVVDGATDERSQVQELAIDTVKRRLEEVSLARVLRVKELQKLQHEAMVNVRLGNVGVEVLAFDKAQEELVDNLNVRPSNLQDGFVLLRIESFSLGVHRGRNGSEEVLGEHFDNSRVHWLRNDLTVISDVVEQFVEGESLDLLGFHVTTGIIEVKNDVALVNLLHEELLASVGGNFVESRKLLQLAVSRDIESRRMLSLGCSETLGHVLGRLVEAIEHERLGARFRRREIVWHGFGSTRGRDVLEID